MAECRHTVRAPEGFHRRLTMRIHIASRQDRLWRQMRRAMAAFVCSISILMALGAFIVYQSDLDTYTPPGLLGHLDYYLAALRLPWMADMSGPLPFAGLLVIFAGVLVLLGWLAGRGKKPAGRVDRLPRHRVIR